MQRSGDATMTHPPVSPLISVPDSNPTSSVLRTTFRSFRLESCASPNRIDLPAGLTFVTDIQPPSSVRSTQDDEMMKICSIAYPAYLFPSVPPVVLKRQTTCRAHQGFRDIDHQPGVSVRSTSYDGPCDSESSRYIC